MPLETLAKSIVQWQERRQPRDTSSRHGFSTLRYLLQHLGWLTLQEIGSYIGEMELNVTKLKDLGQCGRVRRLWGLKAECDLRSRLVGT